MAPADPAYPIRVVLADDYPALHPAIARLLMPSCRIVGHVTNVALLVTETMRLQPDVLVVDMTMASGYGLDACGVLRGAVPAAKIVFYSAADGPDMRDLALAAGADDFVPKSRIAELLPAILRVSGRATTP